VLAVIVVETFFSVVVSKNVYHDRIRKCCDKNMSALTGALWTCLVSRGCGWTTHS